MPRASCVATLAVLVSVACAEPGPPEPVTWSSGPWPVSAAPAAAPPAEAAADVPAEPDVPAGLEAPLVARAELTVEPDEASSAAARRVLEQVLEVRDSVRETRYRHRTRVRASAGYYAFDCSGMTSWFLERAAPRALRAVGGDRPRARDYYRVIAQAPTGKTRRGWQRLGHVSEARPGDVFAFLRSPLSRSRVTGHVGFLITAPVAVPDWPGAYAARILDSTRTPHQHDTRGDDGIGGFGFGTMVFVTDADGEVQGYGWHGTDSAGTLPTHVVFGRVGG
jgi:hypothetical protein